MLQETNGEICWLSDSWHSHFRQEVGQLETSMHCNSQHNLAHLCGENAPGTRRTLQVEQAVFYTCTGFYCKPQALCAQMSHDSCSASLPTHLHTCEPWCTSCQGRVAAAAADPIPEQALLLTASGAAKSVLHHPAAVPMVRHSNSLQHCPQDQDADTLSKMKGRQQDTTSSKLPASLFAGAALGAGCMI
jgi:hypothetical protein